MVMTVIQNSIMDIHIKGIYSSLAFRIERTSRCPEFTTVLSVSYCVFLIRTPLNEVEGVYTGFTLPVCSSVRLWTESCPLCIFHNTISYQQT